MYLFFLMTIDFFSKRKKLRISSYPKKQRKAFLSENPQVLINSPNTPKKKSSDSENKSKKKTISTTEFFVFARPKWTCMYHKYFCFLSTIYLRWFFSPPPQRKKRAFKKGTSLTIKAKNEILFERVVFGFFPKKSSSVDHFRQTRKKKELRIKRKNGEKFFHLPFTDLILLIIFPFHWLSHPRKSKALRKENQFSSKQNLTTLGNTILCSFQKKCR